MNYRQQGAFFELRQERFFAAAWAAVVLTGLALAPWATSIARWVPPCWFKMLTTLPCPLCGTTRAGLALARLDPLHGLMRFPLPTVLWIVFLGGGFVAAGGVLLNRRLPELRCPPRRIAAGLVAAFLVNWVYSIATGV